MWANITGICVLLQARPMLMSRNLKWNASEVARIMSYMSAGVGALELLLNPVAGQLSDKFGRRNYTKGDLKIVSIKEDEEWEN